MRQKPRAPSPKDVAQLMDDLKTRLNKVLRYTLGDAEQDVVDIVQNLQDINTDLGVILTSLELESTA